MINDNDIDQYITLYRLRFSTELSREQAVKQLRQLVGLVHYIYKPLPRKYEDENEQSRPKGYKQAV